MKLFCYFSVCIKCGSNDAITFYNKDSNIMKRRCKCCGYEWLEKPLDSTDKISESHEENDLLVE